MNTVQEQTTTTASTPENAKDRQLVYWQQQACSADKQIESMQARIELLEEGLTAYSDGMIRCRVCGYKAHEAQEIPHDDDCILAALKKQT